MSVYTTLLLADAVFFVHTLFAGFITVGFAAIWIGRALRMRFVGNRTFRIAHATAMGIVATEAVLGIFCPLTELESWLRMQAGVPGAYSSPFIAHWARELFYWDLPQSVFTALYLCLLAAIIATWWLVPVNKRNIPTK